MERRDAGRDPRVTAAEALVVHGFSWERLEQLARRALHDRMRDRRITLDPERYQEALDLYVEVGARWAMKYDPAQARGVSFASSCYRRMHPRLTDYLRSRHGDERHGTPITETPADHMPDHPGLDEETFEQAIASVDPNLSKRARWTLEHLGRAIAEEGQTLASAAARAGITAAFAEELLEELGWQLGRRAAEPEHDASQDYRLLEAWSA